MKTQLSLSVGALVKMLSNAYVRLTKAVSPEYLE